MSFTNLIKKCGLSGGALLLAISGIGATALVSAPTAFAKPPTNITNAVYVSPNGSNKTCSVSSPCQSINYALGVASTNGQSVVYIESGSYNQKINVTSANNGVTITGPSARLASAPAINLGSGTGIDIEGANNVTINDLRFTVSGESNFALHAYKSTGLQLANLSFTAPNNTEGTTEDGVDINSSINTTISNVSVSGFGHNGFSFTSQYSTGDPVTKGVILNSDKADNNGWFGFAFYTVSGSSNGAGSMKGVKFNKGNAITNNAQGGLLIEGDSDANAALKQTPRFTVTTEGNELKLTKTSFKNNGSSNSFGLGLSKLEIVNYQSGVNIKAEQATFSTPDGYQTGSQMSASKLATTENQIIDGNNNNSGVTGLGIVELK